MNDEDCYSDASTNYIINNYQNSLKFLHRIQFKRKCDILMYRIYIGQKKYGVVLNEIPQDSDDSTFRLIRLLAQAYSNPNKDLILSEVETLMNSNLSPDDTDPFVISSAIYSVFREYESALRVLRLGSDHYCDAMTVQILLKINRLDLAAKLVSRMIISDEDSLLCQVAAASYYIAQGGEKLTEALSIYQELQEKWGQSVTILNGQAAALIGMQRWGEAESKLIEAIDLDPNNVDTLINMVCASYHLNQPIETVNRYLNQIKDLDPKHPFVTSLNDKAEEFERCSQLYAPKVA